MMSLMRDEIGQHVADVEGQVAPYIPPRRRDLTPGRKTQLQQRFDGVAAVLQGSHELPPCDTTLIHASRRGNAVFPPQRLDPPAPRVVQMRDRKSTRLNSSHITISYAVFCLKKKKEVDSIDVREIH